MPSLGLGLGLHKQIMMGFKQPIATFTRPTPAYLSDGTQVTANVPRFESGKFGKAILVEEETTNIGSPANLFDGSWILGYPISGTSTIIDTYTRKYTFTLTHSGAFAYKAFTLTTGVTYTWSAEIKGEGSTVGKQVRLQSYVESAYGTRVILTTEWQRITLTFTATDTSRTVGFIGIPGNAFAPGDVVYIRNFQLEQKPYPTSFTDGTRAAETLTIPTEGVLNPQEGTVECWVYIDDRFIDGMAGKHAWIWGTKGDPYYPILNLYRNAATNSLRFVSRDANNNQSYIEKPLSQISVGWHYIACTWKSSRLAFLLDGQLVGEVVSPYLPNAVDAQMYIGHNPRVGEQCNSLIDDLRISNRARSDAEILAAYQSGKPLQRDEWTTYKADFDEKIR